MPRCTEFRPRMARLLPATLALLALACGGANFERAPNAQRYRALPVGTPVRVAGDAAELPQPVELLGTLRALTRGDPANQPEAEEIFRTHAARYGCDAVAGVASTRREVKTTRKTKTLGANGVPVYTDEVIVNAEHDWTAQCLRTAEAPTEPSKATTVAATAPVGPGPEDKPVAVKAEPKKGRKGDAKAEKVEAKTEPKAEPAKVEPAKVEPAKVEPAKVEPAKVEPARVEPAKVEPPKKEDEEIAALPPASVDPIDPKVASEVARAFLGLSDAFVRGQVERICPLLDESVLIDVQAGQPRLRIKQEMSATAACESLKGGELAGYLRDLGPAEVHAEMATLIPTLFGIHGGAFLRLDEAQQKKYGDEVQARRQGLKPLACTLYNVLPAGDLFKVSLTCTGVVSYRVLLRRSGENQFKLMQLNHHRP